MQTVSEIPPKRAPLCGILSVASPLIGFAASLLVMAYVRSRPPESGMDLGLLALGALPTFASLLCGMILAGAAAVREEKLWALRWIGFLVNAGPFLYAVVASHL
jgi:hypothetical protein